MTTTDYPPELIAWLQSRPPHVRRLAEEFPPGTTLVNDDTGELWYMVGYTEDDCLIFSTAHPRAWRGPDLPERYKRLVCARHLREQRVCH